MKKVPIPKPIVHDGVMSEKSLRWPGYYRRLTRAWAWFGIAIIVTSFGLNRFETREYILHIAALFCGFAPLIGLILLSWRIKGMDERERSMVWQAFMTVNSWILAFGCLTWFFSTPAIAGEYTFIGNIAPIALIALPPLGYLFSITVLQTQHCKDWWGMEKGNKDV